MRVKVIAAEKELEVAKVRFEAAEFQAQAITNKAEGERDAIRVHNAAEAQVLTDQVAAFQDGMLLARYVLYQKIAPQIQTILSNDGEKGLGAIFKALVPGVTGGAQ
jgi:regulator of protease activity HflC (stomatin/prohibitin superfamily)